MSRRVIIVDPDDNVVGSDELAEAKRRGLITRVSRVFLFNDQGELYLQKRGPGVDFPGLWDQSAGGHVDVGETYFQAARRELAEEVGVYEADLRQITKYFTDWEYATQQLKRFNVVFVARSDQEPKVDGAEAVEGKWVSLDELDRWVSSDEAAFPQGFIQAYHAFREAHRQQAD
jgi:mutator protein MutT